MTAEPLESPAPPARLAPLLHEDRVPWDVLHERYGSVLELVRVLLGVVPNCDPYLEIWPPAFRSYNVMVPNLLNLPAPIFGVGGAPGDVVGLGMYVASRVAECPYCTAHSCSFAIRRGATPEKMAQALVADDRTFSRGELATVAVARALARVPCELTAAERDELLDVYGAAKAEWIVHAIVMMGFLNKFMNALGVELEQPVVSEVASTLGEDWRPGGAGAELDPSAPLTAPPAADGMATRLRVLPLLPSVVRLDARWQKGVPKSWPQVGAHLRERTGHDFPVLSRLRHRRAVRAIATMLAENLDPGSTVLGLHNKVLAGRVFAEVVADEALAADVSALAANAGQPDSRTPAVLALARAASPSPAEIDAGVVAACRDADLSPAAIVELVTWLAVLQMLHRLRAFHELS